jgi:hypothetical protein
VTAEVPAASEQRATLTKAEFYDLADAVLKYTSRSEPASVGFNLYVVRAVERILADRAAAEDHGLRAVGPVCTDPECPIYERHRRQGRTFPPHGPHDSRAAMGDDK